MPDLVGAKAEAAAAQAERIVEEARRWLGTPYRHQASACGAGTDCLGLVRGIWRAVIGPEPVAPPPYSMDWAEPSKDEVLRRAADHFLRLKTEPRLLLGDVLLFRMRDDAVAKHLGIVSAVSPRGRFIHAYSGYGVVENSLSDPWLRRVVAVYGFPEKGE
ncbi:peptidase [Pseudorhodobacter sp. MZDSW-24AT]|uniref:peptidase n=1 Tax=Pseudorhodobacter sp. MZDSW-24AT TaxID=2052957 RepID=UPI000C1F43E8|nr:peptidase [Pseudorhodobacter sp. MZDSW-24AT]PJF08135.1 peptidase [Pseudorhodobacter sp. MZDSW-24AT]